MPGLIGHKCEHVGVRMGQGHQRREAHMLGTDDYSAAGEPLPVEVNPLLKLSGRHHSRRPAAGHKPGRPGSFPAAGREQDRIRRDRLPAVGAGEGRTDRALLSCLPGH